MSAARATPFPEDRGEDWQAWWVEFAETRCRILTGHPGSARFSEAVRGIAQEDSTALRKVASAWAKRTPDERDRYGLEVLIQGIAAR
jgi:hypothetical protein